MNVLISPSTANEMQLCWRNFMFRKKLDYAPMGERRAAQMGLFVHRLLEIYYRMRYLMGKSFDEARVIAIETCRMEAIELPIAIEDAEHVIDVFVMYTDHHKNDTWSILEVEKEFAVPLYEEKDFRVVVKGKIDLLIDVGGMKIPVDHKGQLKDWKFVDYLDNQMIIYCIVSESNNIIRNQIGLQKEKPADERFKRKTLSYPKGFIDQWKREFVWWCRELIKRQQEDFWPANPTSCSKFGGCGFRRVCDNEEKDWDYMLERDYIKVVRKEP